MIGGARHLERALTVFIDHYNTYRPHRSLDLAPPNGRPVIATWTGAHTMAVKRRDRLGGLIRLRHLNRRAEDSDALRLKHRVEPAGEFGIVIANQKTNRLRTLFQRPRDLPGLLRDPPTT